jgi:hypothetical protein
MAFKYKSPAEPLPIIATGGIVNRQRPDPGIAQPFLSEALQTLRDSMVVLNTAMALLG